MNEMEVKFLIIGAGVSGLAFANHLKSEDYFIVEKEIEPGGYCRTVHEGDYVWDWSGHFFHFATEKWKRFFEDRIKQSEIIQVRKNTKIYYKDKLIDYPFQKNIHQLEKEEFINCLYDLFHREEMKQNDSFKNMLYSKFGRSICELFLIPYNEKLYACDLDSLDSDAMGRFFPYADIEDIINNMKNTDNESYNDYFLYPVNGAQTFIEALMKDINIMNVSLNECVTNIDKERHIVKTNKRTIKYEKLINTMPLNEFIPLVGTEMSVESISCNKVLVFNLGFDKKSKYNDIHWMYIPDKNINFYRVGFYDNILNQDKLSMYIEIGYKENSEINIDFQLQETLKNLKKMGVIDDHKLLNYHYCIMKPAYVHMSQTSRNVTDKLMKEFSQYEIYSIGRYGAWKYCSIEDCLVDADTLYRNIVRESH